MENLKPGNFIKVTDNNTKIKTVGFILKVHTTNVLVYFPFKGTEMYYIQYVPFNKFFTIELLSNIFVNKKFRRADISYVLQKQHISILSKINLAIHRTKLI